MLHPPDHGSPQDLVAACHRLYTAIDRLVARASAIAGVRRNELRCLNMLAEAPAKPGAIAMELGLTTGSVTTLIDRLEEADFARRDRDPDDRRGVIVYPKQHLLQTLSPVYRSVAVEIKRIAATYSDADRAANVRHFSDASSAYELASGLLSAVDIGRFNTTSDLIVSK